MTAQATLHSPLPVPHLLRNRLQASSDPNQAKRRQSEALNYGLNHLNGEEIFVGIDADTESLPMPSPA